MKIDLLFNYKIKDIVEDVYGKRYLVYKRFMARYPYIIFFKGKNYEKICIFDINNFSIKEYNNSILTDINSIGSLTLKCDLYKYKGNFVIFKEETFSDPYRIYMLSNTTRNLEIPTNKSWIVKKENKINTEEYNEFVDVNKELLFNQYFNSSIKYSSINTVNYDISFAKPVYVNKYGYYCKPIYQYDSDSVQILYFKITE